ncbi:MAG TPA: biosynthetic peptidoglycan transglycosylase [Chloroflexota bacterium]|nr:biosynthetic peptidoglycan transglycosylase [Chloroflexota bacterium]
MARPAQRSLGAIPAAGRGVPRRPAPRSARQRSVWAAALRLCATLLLAATLLGAIGGAAYLWHEAPPAGPVKRDLMAQASAQHAEWVPLARVPATVQQAIIATEDARFYEHRGLDLLGMLRATLANLRAGRPVQGGSTISQQLAKRYLERTDPTAERKLLVLAMTAKIELLYSKADILEMYLNSIYFGPYAYGIGSAARVYFHKPVADLTLAESTLLAGLPQAPSLYDPLHRLDRVKARQTVVIAAMERAGYLTPAEADAARRARTALDP